MLGRHTHRVIDKVSTFYTPSLCKLLNRSQCIDHLHPVHNLRSESPRVPVLQDEWVGTGSDVGNGDKIVKDY